MPHPDGSYLQDVLDGEATKQLSLPLRQANPDIRRRAIAGMRDVPIQGYRGVDLAEVYKAATVSIPDKLPASSGFWPLWTTNRTSSEHT